MNRTVCLSLERSLPLCGYAVEFLGPAATFGRGSSRSRRGNEFFLLQPISEASVNCTDGDILFRSN